MKKLFILSTLSILFVLASSAGLQAQSLSGSQTKGNGSNAVLKCSGLQITKNLKIVKVTGVNAGFWIVKGNATIKKYWKANDPTAIGLTLKPGKYYVYPNLPNRVSNATVTLHFK